MTKPRARHDLEAVRARTEALLADDPAFRSVLGPSRIEYVLVGYIAEGVGTGFPDCDAKRSVSRTGDVWERVRIELEVRSRNFLDHGHRAEDCDVLVCWEHNWSDCPIDE